MASSIQSIPTKTITNALNYFVLNGNNCTALPSSNTPRLRKVSSGNNLKLTPPSKNSPKKSHKRNGSLNKNLNYKVLVDDFPILSSSHTTPEAEDKNTTFFEPFDKDSEPTFENAFVNESFASAITPDASAQTTPTTTSTNSSFLRKNKFSNSKKIYDLLHTNAKLKEERLSLLEELHLYSSNTNDFYEEDPSIKSEENFMMVFSPTSDHPIVKSQSEEEVMALPISPTSDSLSFFSQDKSTPTSTAQKSKDLKLEAIHALQNMTHKQTEHISYLKHKIEICKKALEEKDTNISNLEMLLKQSRKESFIVSRKMKSQEKELENIQRELVSCNQKMEEMNEQQEKDQVTILEYEGMVDEKNQLEFELELSKRNFLECSELLGEKEMEVEEWKDLLAQKELEVKKLHGNKHVPIMNKDDEEEWIQSLEKEIFQKELLSTQTNLKEQLELVKLLQFHNKEKVTCIAELQSQIQSLIQEKTLKEEEVMYLSVSLSNVKELLTKYQQETKILAEKVGGMEECISSSYYGHLWSFLNLQERNALSSFNSDKFSKAISLVRELSELTNAKESVDDESVKHVESIEDVKSVEDVDAAREIKSEIEEEEEQVLKLQNEKEHLVLDLQTLRETIQVQQTQIYELQTENTTLQEEVTTTNLLGSEKAETMEKEMEKLRTWARKALEQVKRLEKEKARAKKTIKGLQRELGQQQQQNMELSSAASAIHSLRSTSPTTITGEGTSEMNNSIHGGASISNNSGMDISRHSTTSIDNNAKLEYLKTLNKIHENTMSTTTNNDQELTNLKQKNMQLEKDLNKFKTAAATIRSELIKTQNAGECKERQYTLDVEKLTQENQAYEIKIAALENQFHEWNKNNNEDDKIKSLNDQITKLQSELAKTNEPQLHPSASSDNEEVNELKAVYENIIETLRVDVSNLSREKLIITQEKNKQLRFMQQEKVDMEEEYTRRIQELEEMLEERQMKKHPWNASDDNHLETVRSLKMEKEEMKQQIQDHEDTIADLRSSSLYKFH